MYLATYPAKRLKLNILWKIIIIEYKIVKFHPFSLFNIYK